MSDSIYGVPRVDFSKLSEIADSYIAARRQALRDQAIASATAPDGSIDFSKASGALLKAGDIDAAGRVANVANSNDTRALARDQFDFQKKQAEINRIPQGFKPNVEGLQPITGGPADPNYLRTVTDAKDKGRQMSITDITKLSDEGGKFANLTGFINDFKDDYAGYKLPAIGNAAMFAGRYAPGMVPKNTADAATFWQGYDRYKNVVRNDLFGAALTKSEQAAFEQADVNPGMDPEMIRKNLSLQKDVVQNGLKRKANAMIAAGYDPKAIANAYGVSLQDIGVSETPRRGYSKQEVMGARANPAKALQDARDAIARGADRNAVLNELKSLGIDASGL